MKKILAPLAVLSLVVFCNGQTYQTFASELKFIQEKARWRFGPIRAYPIILLREVGYEDNVYNQPEKENPISDYTATVSPQLHVYLVYKNWLLFSFMENPEYVFYMKESRERAFNNNFSPSLKMFLFNRVAISGTCLYRQSRRRASSEFDVRANETINSYNVRIFFETPRETAIGVLGTIDQIQYEDILRPNREIYLSRELNRQEQHGVFEFYYRIFSESVIFFQGEFTAYRFEHPEARDRDSDSCHALVGIRFPLLGRVRGTFSIGYKKLWPLIADKKSFEGIIGSSSLDFRTGRLGLRLRYDRDSRFSYWTNNIYFIEDRYGLGMSYYLTRDLRLDYDFSFGRGDYPELVPTGDALGRVKEIRKQDTYLIHSAGIVFRIIQDTGLGLMVSSWERESTLITENRQKWFIGGYLTHNF